MVGRGDVRLRKTTRTKVMGILVLGGAGKNMYGVLLRKCRCKCGTRLLCLCLSAATFNVTCS